MYKVQIIFKNGDKLDIAKEFKTPAEAGIRADSLAEHYRNQNKQVYSERIYLVEA